MINIRNQFASSIAIGFAMLATTAIADPCGMVPPITTEATPLTRTGLQRTYVFYQDGVETFVIRPEFSGHVDQFGMLIPFPKPPAIRKTPDAVFEHLAAAIDPPEVVIDLTYIPPPAPQSAPGGGGAPSPTSGLQWRSVRVIRREAVGMYEVAVLEAGSAEALSRWMDEHGFRYPAGMDKACNDYIETGWCFVAVKTLVSRKDGVDPKPGQRTAEGKLPSGAVFDGNVQAMGFRFRTEELVVPMRLSTFNEGELRNIVYLLTDEPKKIRSIPEEYVMRQISGEELHRNVTGPLPLRVIGGTIDDVQDWQYRGVEKRRDPARVNKIAKELFAADLIAVTKESLALPHEENEKQLLAIGERLQLRGKQIDDLNAKSMVAEREVATTKGLGGIKSLTMTVIDGDFPRELLAKQNLTFASYEMPGAKNKPVHYDAVRYGPIEEKPGIVYRGEVTRGKPKPKVPQRTRPTQGGGPPPPPFQSSWSQSSGSIWLTSILLTALLGVLVYTRRKASHV